MWEHSPGAFVDPACPVEWAHPLNRGLVAWLAAPPNPGWSGGLTLRDLVRGGKCPHDGALTNGPTWAAGPNGSRALNLSASAYVDLSAGVAGLVAATPVLLTFVYAGTLDSGQEVYSLNAGANQFIVYFGGGITGGLTDELISVYYYDGVTLGLCGYCTATRSELLDGRDHHVAIYCSGSAWSIYLDGVSRVVSAGYGNFGLYAPPSPTTAYLKPVGRLGEFSLRRGAWADAGVAALYGQSRRGHPDTLRWVSSRAWFTPAGGGGGSTTAVGTSAGTSTAAGVGRAVARAAGTSAGTATAAGAGRATARTAGIAAGTGTASGVGRKTARAAGTSSGTAAAAAAGRKTARAAGTSAGTSTAVGVGRGTTAGTGVGTSAGTSTTAAVGRAAGRSAGISAGTATVVAVGRLLARAFGSAFGAATAAGAGSGGLVLVARRNLSVAGSVETDFFVTGGEDVAVRANLTWHRGEDVTVTGVVAGAGSIAAWALRFAFAGPDGTPIFAKTLGAGIAVADPVARTLVVTVDEADTVGLDPGVYRYEVARTNAGAEAVLTEGRVRLARRAEAPA